MATLPDALAGPRSTAPRSSLKLWLWIALGLITLSVIPFTELPVLRDTTGFNVGYRAKLFHDRLLLLPHALCGTVALLSGPVQFSSRIRRKYLQLHRILGRVYVGCIFVAAPIALILTPGSGLEVATWVQSGAWMVCTLAALLTARNRHIAQHRQWMVRSYAVTFTFVSLRFLDFLPSYARMGVQTNLLVIIIVTFVSVFLPDLAFNWRELTTRRT